MIKEVLGITVGIGLGLAASRWIYKSLRGERRPREVHLNETGGLGDRDEYMADLFFRKLDNIVNAVVAVVAPQPPPPPDPPNPHI
ncbi:Hypothetical predicted protein [Mytilus galloprovincialis]|uniref:Uncharacterized protein n=1 Tax=Mytilus galloprovincialis TaxID=29158 RepID=A0A8B6HSY1_MYTGA|nr:Hypothetical predicted protein [Mytilus galloprovincialis]